MFLLRSYCLLLNRIQLGLQLIARQMQLAISTLQLIFLLLLPFIPHTDPDKLLFCLNDLLLRSTQFFLV